MRSFGFDTSIFAKQLTAYVAGDTYLFAENKELAMSQTTRRIALLFCCTLSLAVLANTAEAQTLTVLYNFTGGNDGAIPAGGLTMDRAGNFYGITTYDGAGGYGTVFRLSRAGSGWVLTPLYSFTSDDGHANPGVVIGPDGNLYGTTSEGLGSVYRLQRPATACHSVICPWTKTVIYTFDGGHGSYPTGNLIFDQAGNIYGTAIGGGPDGEGTVYELSPSNGGWTPSVLWSFIPQTGYLPQSGVTFDNSGNLYGTTSRGGANDGGVVYELSPSGSGWTQTVLYTNSSSNLDAGVVIDGQGNLYGASCCGHHYDQPGVVFELTPSNGSWIFNVLYAFDADGSGPVNTPTLDTAGNVYGTSLGTGANNLGEVYKLTPSNGGWTYNSVSFDGSNGKDPYGSVILDAAGNIYGTAEEGGTGLCNINGIMGCGVVWEITP